MITVEPVTCLAVSVMCLCISQFLIFETIRWIYDLSNKNLTERKECATIKSDKDFTTEHKISSEKKSNGKKITVLKRTPEQRRDVIRNKARAAKQREEV